MMALYLVSRKSAASSRSSTTVGHELDRRVRAHRGVVSDLMRHAVSRAD